MYTQLIILVAIGYFVWKYIHKKDKKKIERPARDNDSRQKNIKPKFCSECGASLGDNDHFCPVCGAKVVYVNESDQKKSSIKKAPSPLSPSSKKIS